MNNGILDRHVSHGQKLVEQRVSLMLNRFWKSAQLLWVSDGSRVYGVEHAGAPAVLKVFVPMDIGHGRLEPIQDTLERYERELEAASQFSRSEFGLDVLDAGIRARVPFLVFPRIVGRNLEAQIDHGQVDARRGRKILGQIAQAVYELHQMGFIHADLKLSNILLEEDRVYLIDFGCVRRIGEARRLGDPAYFSVGYTAPECLSGQRKHSVATDMFSFGMIAHELVGAGNPFQLWYAKQPEDDLDSYCHYVDFLEAEIIPSIGQGHELPRALVHGIDRCIENDPLRRPKGLASILRALGLGSTVTRKRGCGDVLHAA